MVQEVIAAIKIDPSLISKSVCSTLELFFSSLPVASLKTFLKFEDASLSKTLSCGLFGPEIVGTTFDISREIVSVKSISSLAQRPWAFAYSLTILTSFSFLPENFKYFNVSSSIGKNPQVAPYSGAMLAIVARSARDRFFKPSPKNSTNLPTTPLSLSIFTTVRTKSVAVVPSGNLFFTSKPITSGISIEIGCPSIPASASIPPTPHPRTDNPFTIVVWLSVPTNVSGNR